ncbi:hypothetical protein MCUN1_001234 [Malassezia cuniculi]|uniref:Uncharacterized protein n=1 Tax=Malassezia cuniculi TaxID=948313 RepID=A0AAF0J5T7_9BASI|nr:hypothetical protein MCUN1_001234 [Malassezia cuniculi]
MRASLVALASAALLVGTEARKYNLRARDDKPTFSIDNLPDTWEKGQVGTNQCTKYGDSDENSMCQNVFVNSARDFCLWAPYKGGDTVGEQEEEMVSYCLRSGYGTRLIPDGTIKSAYFLKTDSFVQVTGRGDFTSMNILDGDDGGELDPHGATGAGNPPGGLVFTNNKKGEEGNFVQLKEWNNFMSYNEFSIRACWGGWAQQWCPHIYDEMGAEFNSPAKFKAGGFEDCEGLEGEWPGVYSGSTWHQGMDHTPKPQKPGSSSNCKTYSTVSNAPARYKPYKRSFRFDRI